MAADLANRFTRAIPGLFILLIFTGLLLRIHALTRSSSLMEYDPHFEYIEEIRARYTAALFAPRQQISRYSFPAAMRASGSDLRWHPPAYHALGALLGVLPLKIFTVLCNVLTAWLLFLLLRHFFGNDHALILPGVSLLMLLPGHILLGNFASNDVLLVPGTALFLLLSSKWRQDAPTDRRIIALSLLCALLLLTKYTGLISFVCLNVLLLDYFVRARIAPARLSRLAFLAWVIPAILAGWFYWANYTIWGDPLHIPGYRALRQHSFTTFAFAQLLSSKVNNWHESSSVLTGFFASLFSFDAINANARESALRNAVYCQALLPWLIAVLGAISSARKEKYFTLNLFFLISLAAITRFLSHQEQRIGPLKGTYVMFLAPPCLVYLAEGCARIRSWNQTALHVCLTAVLCLDATVIAYYCRFFIFPS